MFFLRCFYPVWVLVRVFQKMQKISAPDRGPVLAIKIRKAKKKTGNQLISGLDRLVEVNGLEPLTLCL